MRNYSFNKGFTLAEVLITLAIVGVVAAITVPTLVANYQQKALNNQFKKSYAFINQALLSTIGDFGYIPQCYYRASDNSYIHSSNDCTAIREKFFSKMKISRICEGNAYADGCIPEYEGMDTVANANNPDAEVPEGYESYGDYASRGCTFFQKDQILNDRTVYVVSDGTIIIQYASTINIIAVDINGLKGPNKWGYDLFSFMLKFDGSRFYYDGGGCMYAEKGGIGTATMILRLQRNQL